MAKKANTRQDADSKKLTDHHRQMQERVAALENQLAALRGEKTKQLNLLHNISTGLYEEMDKLSKKAPAETVTNLALDHINDVIKDTKLLVQDDPYVQKLKEFVPAGDNPENRDVVLILRTVQQGLVRFRESISALDKLAISKLQEARFVVDALNLRIGTGNEVTDSKFDAAIRMQYSSWFIQEYGHRYFDFNKLDFIDIQRYFSTDDLL